MIEGEGGAWRYAGPHGHGGTRDRRWQRLSGAERLPGGANQNQDLATLASFGTVPGSQLESSQKEI